MAPTLPCVAGPDIPAPDPGALTPAPKLRRTGPSALARIVAPWLWSAGLAPGPAPCPMVRIMAMPAGAGRRPGAK